MGKSAHAVRLFSWKPATIPGNERHFIHIGVAIFNRLYHFTTSGVTINYGLPENYSAVGAFSISHRTFAEFEQWVGTKKRQVYSNATYDLITHNSITFTRDAVAFLGVDMDPEALELLDWLRENEPSLRPLMDRNSEFHRRLGVSTLMLALATSSFLSNPPKTVEVLDVVVNLSRLDLEMERQFADSKIGGRYEKNNNGAICYEPEQL